MDEIKVVVSQEPGKISWNYDEIKKMLEVEMGDTAELCIRMKTSGMPKRMQRI